VRWFGIRGPAVVDTASEGLTIVVDLFTHGQGAAVVIETTSVPAFVRLAVDMIAGKHIPLAVLAVAGRFPRSTLAAACR
jgi:hypothetical protein